MEPAVHDLIERGEEAHLQGRHQHARAHFEAALRACPSSTLARQNLAVVLWQLGAREHARSELESAVRGDPGSSIARINLARILLEEGEPQAALLQLVAARLGRDADALVEQAAELGARFDERIVELVAQASAHGLDPQLLCQVGVLLGLARAERPGEPALDRQLRRHAELIRFVCAHHAPGSQRLLDVGCGNGGLLRGLHQAGFSRLHACDLAAGIQTGEIPGLEVRPVDLDAHGLAGHEDQSFELVVCSDVIEHLEHPARLLREISRVLRPGGELFLSFPNAFNRFERLAILRTGNSTRYPRCAPSSRGHISMLPLSILHSLCGRAGLAVLGEGRGYCYLHGHFWFPERSFTHADSYVCSYRLAKQPLP